MDIPGSSIPLHRADSGSGDADADAPGDAAQVGEHARCGRLDTRAEAQA